MMNKLSYENLQRRYKQLAEAMGADVNAATHEDCLEVAHILNKIKVGMLHDKYEETGYYFICGDTGGKDDVGLPDNVLICPAAGLAGFAVYRKVQNYSEPGY